VPLCVGSGTAGRSQCTVSRIAWHNLHTSWAVIHSHGGYSAPLVVAVLCSTVEHRTATTLHDSWQLFASSNRIMLSLLSLALYVCGTRCCTQPVLSPHMLPACDRRLSCLSVCATATWQAYQQWQPCCVGCTRVRLCVTCMGMDHALHACLAAFLCPEHWQQCQISQHYEECHSCGRLQIPGTVAVMMTVLAGDLFCNANADQFSMLLSQLDLQCELSS
jgi:hypothetical protein